jgi:hypothetical protein
MSRSVYPCASFIFGIDPTLTPCTRGSAVAAEPQSRHLTLLYLDFGYSRSTQLEHKPHASVRQDRGI